MTTKRRATAKDGEAAIAMLSSEKRARTTAAAEPAATRKCIGSARIGIEAHEAPPADFPVQPSQPGGLGRLCKPHWTEYTRGLARDAKARRGEAPISPGWVATIAKADKRAAARKTEGEQIVGAVDDAIARLVASEAAAKLPETIATRRAKFEARVAEVGVASDEGQQILEAVGAESARGRKPMAEAVDGTEGEGD